MRIPSAALVLACGASVAAVDAWPGQTTAQAEAGAAQLLAALDPNLQLEISGVHWNPDTQTLWVTAGGSSGKGTWALSWSGTACSVLGYWASPRDEDITQADLAPVAPGQHRIFIIKEGGPTRIVEGLMTVNPAGTGTSTTPRTWTIDEIPPNGGSGAEGICFVPDAWLTANSFTDGSGAPWTGSLGGLGGLMLVAHQDGGYLYAIDLSADGTARFAGKTYRIVGGYRTGLGESSALCFDRTIGRLYISHNTGGNRIEITDLTSTGAVVVGRPLVTRQLTQLGLFAAPALENPEGFACTPYLTPAGTLNDQHFAFFGNDRESTDSAASKARSVVRYRFFDPAVATGLTMVAIAGSGQIGAVGSDLAVAPVVRLRDGRGYPLVGQPVSFSVMGGDAVSATAAITDGQGVATCGIWRLGAAAGLHVLSITSPAVPGSLDLAAVARQEPPCISATAGAQPSVLIQQ